MEEQALVRKESRGVKEKFSFKVPHTYVILFVVLIFFSILGYIIPSGEFQRVQDLSTGKMVVVPGTYRAIEGNPPSVFDIFIAVQRGFIEVADIIFFIFFAYGYVYMLIQNGTLDAILGFLIRKLGNRVELLIPVIMMTFGILGATMGMYEEVYGLFPVFIGIAVALGYDAIVGGAMVTVGVATGFAAAITNPFTLGVAQGIIGLPLFSGVGYRVIVFLGFQIVAILYVWNYARKVKENPEKSYMYGVQTTNLVQSSKEELLKKNFTREHKICAFLFGGTIGFLVFGTMKLGWYINEIAGLFLMMMLIVGIISRFSLNKICNIFTESGKEVIGGVLACGFSRAILIVLNDAKITDTIVNNLGNMLHGTSTYISAFGMLVIQNIINFFITGGSGQASITMPIMGPISQVIGLSKQVTVLAFQFGDGFSNMFWPTSAALVCGLMGIPLNKWYRFITPLFLIMFLMQVVFIFIAVFIDYV